MTKKGMILAYGKELKLLDNLAVFYLKNVISTNSNVIVFVDNEIAFIKAIVERKNVILNSLIDNGANPDKAYYYIKDTFTSLSKLTLRGN